MRIGDEKVRGRVLGRLQQHLARRRSPRAILSGILVVTALAGLLASVGMLKLDLGAMWLRYPLAVLAAWGVFLGLVRMWAEQEREVIREEDFDGLGTKDDIIDGQPGRSVLEERGSWLDWLDWLNPLDAVDDAAGCLVGLAILAAVVALAGAVVAVAGLIVQAEVLLAEVLLDAVLVSALCRRLHRLEPRWWLKGALRQTVWPVVATMVFLMAAGFLLGQSAPGADSVGDVWRHWRGPQ